MNASPSHTEIVDALKQSGYLMEQEVATQLEALDFHVSTNLAYEDIEEGKSREIDVSAIKKVAHNEEKNLSAFVEIIAECKNSMNPFVFIGRPKNQTDNQHPPQELVCPIAMYSEPQKDHNPNVFTLDLKDAFFHLGFDKVHYDFASETKAVQFCRVERKGKGWHANHGGLYDSIFYPMAKAFTARKHAKHIGNLPRAWHEFWLFVPMVIVSGDILYVDSMKANPVPEERTDITFKREIKSEKLDGVYTVAFVRQKHLERFVSDRLGPLVNKMADLTINHANFVLEQNITGEGRTP